MSLLLRKQYNRTYYERHEMAICDEVLDVRCHNRLCRADFGPYFLQSKLLIGT